MNLDRLLAPRSVAVVGATPRPGSYGNQALENLVEAAFDGPVFGVHPRETEVLGVPCFPTLSDLPEVPDAIVLVEVRRQQPSLRDRRRARQLSSGAFSAVQTDLGRCHRPPPFPT